MEPKVLVSNGNYVNKSISHEHKKTINIDRVDIKKIVLHKKDSYGNKGAFKYFIGYNDYNDGIIPLYIKLPIMNAIAKYFNDSKDINILVYGKKLLKNIIQ